MASELFKEYYTKLRNEGILKSLLCGLIAGFAVAFLLGLIFWATGFKLWWLCLVAVPVVAAGVGALCYFYKFRPTTKGIAKRVDALGLEERLLTMAELQNDDSYIAMRQREDAQAALASVNKSMLKFTLSVPFIVALALVCSFGTGMITVSALSAYGVIPSGVDIGKNNNKPATVEYTLSYAVEGEGKLLLIGSDGQLQDAVKQAVAEGEDASPVIAFSAEGWVFVGWSDGVETAYRFDRGISKDISVTAIFEQDDDDGDSDDGEGEDPEDGQGSGQRPGNKPGDNTATGGKFESYNQIINGQTYYVDFYEQYYKEALEKAEGLPDDVREAIGDYFGAISK